MTPSRGDLQAAIVDYWATKDKQGKVAESIHSTSEGTAKTVRGAGHFTPIANLLARFFAEAGYPEESIAARGSRTILPGHFRASKAWDLVVIHREVLVAAIELKGLGSPSHGKNINNRIEEALGNSLDLSHASLAHLTGREKPWMAYFFLIEDNALSRRPGKPQTNPLLPNSGEWKGLSQQQRFAITGRRLIADGLYDAVCYVASSPSDPALIEPDPLLDWRHFGAAIEARLTYLKQLGLP